MISRLTAFADSKGNTYGTLEAAQKAELALRFKDGDETAPNSPWSIDEIVSRIIDDKDKIIDILTTTPTSKVKARKINGATKTRAPKKHVAEQFPLPMPSEDNTKPAA